VASEAPPPEGLTYWQALVDPSTNLTYYWNSSTNEVSWTIPEGGVITLPVPGEKAEAQEKELEQTLENYPYSATIPAEFTKPGKGERVRNGCRYGSLSVRLSALISHPCGK